MTTTILSYGMGVESTAILLRWILEPETRPCPLSELIVVTSQIGDEFSDTGRVVQTHILPLMRAHDIRYVQVARHGHLEADGITVLSDTRQPSTVNLDGDYRLSDELRRNGTAPQFAGVHRCALKFKAFVIEKWLTDNVRGEAAHAIGYNAQETGRVETSEYAIEQRANNAPASPSDSMPTKPAVLNEPTNTTAYAARPPRCPTAKRSPSDSMPTKLSGSDATLSTTP